MKPYPVRCMDCHRTTGRCEVPHSTGLCERCFARRYGGEKPGVDPMVLVLGAAMIALYGAIIWLWLTPDISVAEWFAR
jgi:hypothetical protein